MSSLICVQCKLCQYRSVAPNYSLSDLTDIHLNTVVFFSAAFFSGSEFQGQAICPQDKVIEVTKVSCLLSNLVPQYCF